MTRIIAYTYEGDVYCPTCTAADAAVGILYREPTLPLDVDEHGIACDLLDWEGNPVRPVFSTDEHEFTHCNDCGESL